MKITESRANDILHWLDDMATDHTLLFEDMMLHRDAAALIRQLQAELQDACHARLELLEALKMARAELAGLPHSLGYEFTHLPKIDAVIGREQGKGDHAHQPPSAPVGVEGLPQPFGYVEPRQDLSGYEVFDEPGPRRAAIWNLNGMKQALAQQPAAGTHVGFVKWFNSCGVQDRPPSQLARAAWDAALSSQQPAAVDGEADCRCIDCGGNQPGHDPTCSYMHELHGEQPTAVDDATVAKLTKGQRTRLVEKLVADQVEGADRMSSYLWEVLENGFRGYNNYTDQELLDAHLGAFDEDFFGLESGDDQ